MELFQNIFFSCGTFLVEGELKPKLQTCFLHIFVNVMEKELCTKFFSIDQFDNIMKLQSFEFDVSDVILPNLENISHLVFFEYIC